MFGRVAGVVPGEATAAGDDAFRQGDLVAEHDVAQVVEDVGPPVAELAVAAVPIPVPVVVEFIAENLLVFGGAEPEVVVERHRRLQRSLALADRGTLAIAVAAHVFDLSEFAGVEEILDSTLEFIAALLGAALDDAVVFAGGFDDLATFPDVVGDGFFNIDVLPCLDRPDGGECVPVVAGGNDDGVDVFVLDKFAQISRALGVRKLLLGGRDAVFIRVAEVGDIDVLDSAEPLDGARAASAEADEADADCLVGTGCPS